MKGKIPPEDLRLWQHHVKDVKPLPETKKEPEKPPLRKQKPLQSPPLEKVLKGPLPLSPPQAFDRKEFRRVKIESRLDLHGMTLEEGYQALERFLRRAQENGFKTVLVV